jgi:maltokinase
MDLMAVPRASAILQGKRWYGGEPVTGVRLLEPVGEIEHVLAEVDGGAAYQLLVGPSGDDEVGAPAVAERVLGRPVRSVRALGAEQSNSSVIVDDEVLVKVFRKLHHGPNPDVEVPAALAAVGFDDVVAPEASWREDGWDLAVAVPFLGAVLDGWTVALAHDGDPTELGATIGHLTARMHGALAEAFGTRPTDPDGLLATYARACTDAAVPPAPTTLDALRALDDPGCSTRVHGDYHLGQLLRHDARWYVIDFEGEPNRSLAERRAPAPPLKDLAGMLRSFAYAAVVGRHGEQWEQAAVGACRAAYLDDPAAKGLLPSDPEPVLDAYVLEKAVYELAYERGFRPDWAWIPEKAVRDLVGGRG